MTAREVVRADERGRYELLVDSELAGFADYTVGDGTITFTHTEVFDSHRGEGLGSVLVGRALTDAARRGERIIHRCPYVRRYLEKNEVDGAEVELP